tara:strand:+ start:345 stop:638 length:294 start_codon:yes stop_codon:yes gene_type:complete
MKTPFKMKGWSPFTTDLTKKTGLGPREGMQKHEGNETMGAERLFELTGKTYPGGTDYYITRDKNNKLVVKGEVSLEGGKVTGVPGSEGGKLTRKQNR